MKFLSSERLSQHKYKTPEGYLICVDAILARTGKQTYRKNEVFADSEDDSEIEVDRKPEEVFSPTTLASFENKPITVEHPDEDVNAGNYNELSVGFVRDVHKGVAEGQDVMLGTLVITDAQTIEEIENGEHTDLSCGYDCDIIDEENPQQRNIRGNHVALCQCGRAGIARIVDSIKDEDIFKVDVSSAEDRDVSRFITEAQNVGFTTEDKGYTIYLKNGNRDMLNRLKARTHTTAIKFVDSVRDYAPPYAVWVKKNGKWLIYGGSNSSNVNRQDFLTKGYEDVKVVKNGQDVNDSIKDAQSVMFKGENTFIFANKDMIPERTHYKGDVKYEGKEYYYHEGFDTKRKYLIPIVDSVKDANKDIESIISHFNIWGYPTKRELQEVVNFYKLSKSEAKKIFGNRYDVNDLNKLRYHDSIKDDLVFGYTEQDLRIAKNMLSKAVTEHERKLIESLIAKIEYELTNQKIRDAALYVIYADGTWDNYRALFFKKSGPAKYSSERDADKFTEDEANRIIQSKGKYKWIKRKVGNDTKDENLNKDSYIKFKKGNIIRVKDPNQWEGIKKAEILKDLNDLVEIKINNNIYKTHKSNIIEKIEDELIQSSSEEAFKENIATEIKSGKSPEQATAIAYSVKRNNDSYKDSKPEFEALGKWIWDEVKQDWYDTGRKMYYTEIIRNSSFDSKKKYEVSYIEDSIEHIHVVRANSLQDAIKKVKDDNDLNLLRQYFKETQPNKKMELRHKLKEMGYKEGISGVNSRELMWVELNEKRYEVKNLSTVREL